jgi:hypothetical protein
MTSKAVSNSSTTVTFNSGAYVGDNTLTVANGVVVNPTASAAGATGVYSNYSGAVLDNSGSISGNSGATTTVNNGGIGVDFTQGGTVNNYSTGVINGGYTGALNATGGAGVVLGSTDSLDNVGGIYGGNSDTGNGGVALDVAGAGSSIQNQSGAVITGGSSYSGFSGGNGVDLLAAAEVHNFAGGRITGGTTYGGSGGVGVYVNASGATLLNDAGGFITGGVSVTGSDGAGVDLAANATMTNAGSIAGGSSYSGSSSGGAGVDLAAANATVTNTGSITGGFSLSGSGGAGVDLAAANATMTNTGSITGGNSQYGSGGVGVILNGGMLTTSGSVAGGHGVSSYNYAVDFQSSSTMVVESGAKFTGDIGGFAHGDTIDLTNLAFTGQGPVLDSTTTYTLDGLTFVGDIGKTFLFSSDGSSGTDVTIACFRRGTRILAERGEVAIESLKIGDRVMTSAGVTKPIRWIGRRSYSGESAWCDSEVLPILIRVGALADDVPRRDLWVSPEHAMFVDGMLIPAAALVNGVSIVQDDSIDEVTYIHLEFDTHTVIYAEGAASESFVDDESRSMFDNASEYARLYPNTAPEPARFCAPRVEDGEELEEVRRRLAARAERLPAASEASGAGCGLVDLARRARTDRAWFEQRRISI